jgi:predicted O-methyltransferase YrrM
MRWWLARQLKSQDRDTFLKAAAKAAVDQEMWAVDLLIEALQHPSHWHREAAARALGDLGDQRAARPLMRLMRDKDQLVREAVAQALGKLDRAFGRRPKPTSSPKPAPAPPSATGTGTPHFEDELGGGEVVVLEAHAAGSQSHPPEPSTAAVSEGGEGRQEGEAATEEPPAPESATEPVVARESEAGTGEDVAGEPGEGAAKPRIEPATVGLATSIPVDSATMPFDEALASTVQLEAPTETESGTETPQEHEAQEGAPAPEPEPEAEAALAETDAAIEPVREVEEEGAAGARESLLESPAAEEPVSVSEPPQQKEEQEPQEDAETRDRTLEAAAETPEPEEPARPEEQPEEEQPELEASIAVEVETSSASEPEAEPPVPEPEQEALVEPPPSAPTPVDKVVSPVAAPPARAAKAVKDPFAMLDSFVAATRAPKPSRPARAVSLAQIDLLVDEVRKVPPKPPTTIETLLNLDAAKKEAQRLAEERLAGSRSADRRSTQSPTGMIEALAGPVATGEREAEGDGTATAEAHEAPAEAAEDSVPSDALEGGPALEETAPGTPPEEAEPASEDEDGAIDTTLDDEALAGMEDAPDNEEDETASLEVEVEVEPVADATSELEPEPEPADELPATTPRHNAFLESLRQPCEHDPTLLLSLRDGLYAADLLIAAACEIDLFSWLARRPATQTLICTSLGLAPRPVDVMVTLFLSYGLLRREGNQLALTPAAADYLPADAPFSLRSYFASQVSRPTIKDILHVLRTGSPAPWASASKQPDWAAAMERPEFAREFSAAMDARGRVMAPRLAEAVDLSEATRLLDVGGGSGIYAAAFLAHYPHLNATIFEKPPVDDVVRKLVDQRDLAHRIDVAAGDMFVALPDAHDVHLFSNVLHDWDLPSVRRALVQSFRALPVGGRVIIHDVHLADEKDGPRGAAEYSVFLMCSTPGRCYSIGEMAGLLREVGFVDAASRNLVAERSVIVARKPEPGT